MGLSYTIDTTLGILRITVMGAPSAEDQAEFALAWTADADYRPGMPILLDNRQRGPAASSGHVKDMADRTNKSRLLTPGTRCAIVVASDVEFGLGRMYATLSDEGPMKTRIFRSIEDAEAWLAEPDCE